MMSTNKEINKFNFAINPGMMLKRNLKSIGITQRELAKRTGLNKTVINELIHGKRSFTIHIASKFVDIFGLPVSYWLNLQNLYDEANLRLNKNIVMTITLSGEDMQLYQNNYKKAQIEIHTKLSNCAV